VTELCRGKPLYVEGKSLSEVLEKHMTLRTFYWFVIVLKIEAFTVVNMRSIAF